MKRSSLTVKFTPFNLVNVERAFRVEYKKEHGEEFKGNFIEKITIGVIRDKGVPDVSDVYNIVQLGNPKTPEDAVYTIMERWLEEEGNAKRGYTGMFCDACKDLAIDIPLNRHFVNIVMGLEDNISKANEAKAKMTELTSKLTGLLDNLESSLKNVDTSESTEDKQESTEVDKIIKLEDK